MCGIFGVRWSWLVRTRPDPDAAVQRALAALQWRGPDGACLMRVGDFVLGCARLWITAQRSRQPLQRRRGGMAGVLNGAITNARALWPNVRPRLATRRRLPNDAWLPLELCAAGQPEQLAALRGHHALAVVDGATDTLWLARDGAGEKPLLVALAAGLPVAFASTAPALRQLGVEVLPGPQGVARYFAFGSDGAPIAADHGITLVSALRGVHVAPRGGPLRPLTASIAAVHTARHGTRPQTAPFAAALHAAVQRCADAEPEVGLALSGGIDSSCLAVDVAAVRAQARVFQFWARGESRCEREVAVAVARHCQLEFCPVDAGPEVLAALPWLQRCHGMPLGDPSVLAVHALARAAAATGVRVLLSGEGGDELLLGYRRHRLWRWLPRARLPLPPPPAWAMSALARTARALASRAPYAELLRVTPPAFAARVLAGDVSTANPVDGTVLADRTLAHWSDVEYADAEFYLRWDLLPKLDVATMAAGIEGRCPFLDADVVAAASDLLPRHRLGKAPLRRAYAGRLPAAVFAGPKRGFALPLDRWFRGDLDWLDLLREPRSRQRPHLQPGAIDLIIDRHRSRRADLGRALYLLVAFELWLRDVDEERARCA